MSVALALALAVVLGFVAALSLVAARGVRAGPDADQIRGFCVVGAAGAGLVGAGVLAIGLLWDTRIADSVALIALFALVVYYLVALIICLQVRQPRRRRRTAIPAATTLAVPAPTRPKRTAFRPVR